MPLSTILKPKGYDIKRTMHSEDANMLSFLLVETVQISMPRNMNVAFELWP